MLGWLYCASDYNDSTAAIHCLRVTNEFHLFLLVADRTQWELSKRNVLFYWALHDRKIATAVRYWTSFKYPDNISSKDSFLEGKKELTISCRKFWDWWYCSLCRLLSLLWERLAPALSWGASLHTRPATDPAGKRISLSVFTGPMKGGQAMLCFYAWQNIKISVNIYINIYVCACFIWNTSSHLRIFTS